jgi:demethylmenaquinone methyltransferase/2-methoxy-6-polyprenyl-1,4-benzoquinol methylase
MARGLDARVVGVDLSAHMLEQAGRDLAATGLDVQIDLVAGRAESLPFPDSCFDAVCFAYLLRYVEDPSATVKEVARVLKPGGILASLDFGVPTNFVCRGLWLVYTRLALPLATRCVSQAWRNVGVFLGGSISGFYRDNSLEQLGRMWNEAGIPSVQIKSMSFGAGVVMWGAKGNAMKVP